MKFALFSAILVTGTVSIVALGAGCTVTAVNPNPTPIDSGAPDGSARDGSKTDGIAPPGSCAVAPKGAADFNELYKPAAPRKPGSCTAAQITAINAATTYSASIAAADTASCKACVVTPETAAAWGALIVDDKGAFVLDNAAGACAYHAASPACGQFQSKFQNCADIVCSTCADADAFKGCSDEVFAQDDPEALCQNAAADELFVTSCSATDNTNFDNNCNTFTKAVTYLCGPATVAADAGPDTGADGGSDGGADAGADARDGN